MLKTITQKKSISHIIDSKAVRHPLPKSWKKAAGLLRNRKKALEHHLIEIRRELIGSV